LQSSSSRGLWIGPHAPGMAAISIRSASTHPSRHHGRLFALSTPHGPRCFLYLHTSRNSRPRKIRGIVFSVIRSENTPLELFGTFNGRESFDKISCQLFPGPNLRFRPQRPSRFPRKTDRRHGPCSHQWDEAERPSSIKPEAAVRATRRDFRRRQCLLPVQLAAVAPGGPRRIARLQMVISFPTNGISRSIRKMLKVERTPHASGLFIGSDKRSRLQQPVGCG